MFLAIIECTIKLIGVEDYREKLRKNDSRTTQGGKNPGLILPKKMGK